MPIRGARRAVDVVESGAEPLPPAPRSPALITLAVLTVTVVGLLSMWLLGGHGRGQSLAANGLRVAPRVLDAPTRTHIDEPHRLLPPVAVDPATRSTSYRFIGGPHGPRWEACRPIHFVVRPGGEGPRFDAILQSAVAEVSRATGLKFVDDGATTEVPLRTASRDLYQPGTYGDRWAPVLVAWSNVGESPRLAGRVEGFARPGAWAARGEPVRLVSGTVVYDVDKLLVLEGELGDDAVRTVVLHELGHLVGLAHFRDRAQVMFPTIGRGSPEHFAAGDRTGLAELGTGPCFTDY